MKTFKYTAKDTRHISIAGSDINLVKNKIIDLPEDDQYVKSLIGLGELKEVLPAPVIEKPVVSKKEEKKEKPATAESDTKTESEK